MYVIVVVNWTSEVRAENVFNYEMDVVVECDNWRTARERQTSSTFRYSANNDHNKKKNPAMYVSSEYKIPNNNNIMEFLLARSAYTRNTIKNNNKTIASDWPINTLLL